MKSSTISYCVFSLFAASCAVATSTTNGDLATRHQIIARQSVNSTDSSDTATPSTSTSDSDLPESSSDDGTATLTADAGIATTTSASGQVTVEIEPGAYFNVNVGSDSGDTYDTYGDDGSSYDSGSYGYGSSSDSGSYDDGSIGSGTGGDQGGDWITLDSVDPSNSTTTMMPSTMTGSAATATASAWTA